MQGLGQRCDRALSTTDFPALKAASPAAFAAPATLPIAPPAAVFAWLRPGLACLRPARACLAPAWAWPSPGEEPMMSNRARCGNIGEPDDDHTDKEES